jgi:hypothetical protein
VSVFSPWLQALADVPPSNICDLQLLRSTPQSDANEDDLLSRKPGIVGPLGLCWRPIAYDPDAFAQLKQPSNKAAVAAHLAGDLHTSALLVADFGVGGEDHEQHLLDASSCELVCVHAKLSGEPDASAQDYRVVLVSSNSATCEALTSGAKNSACDDSDSYPCYCISLSNCVQPNPFLDGVIDETHWDKRVDEPHKVSFDASQIRYVGIQKDWNNRQDFSAEVLDIEFHPPNTDPYADSHTACSPRGL